MCQKFSILGLKCSNYFYFPYDSDKNERGSALSRIYFTFFPISWRLSVCLNGSMTRAKGDLFLCLGRFLPNLFIASIHLEKDQSVCETWFQKNLLHPKKMSVSQSLETRKRIDIILINLKCMKVDPEIIKKDILPVIFTRIEPTFFQNGSHRILNARKCSDIIYSSPLLLLPCIFAKKNFFLPFFVAPLFISFSRHWQSGERDEKLLFFSRPCALRRGVENTSKRGSKFFNNLGSPVKTVLR